MPFDPDAAAAPGTGVFGLPFTREESRVILLPVPFDATTSYRRGTAAGPAAIREASAQVDLFDRAFGRIYERGIFMEELPPEVIEANETARTAADPIIEVGGIENMSNQAAGRALLAKVNAACESVNELVYARTKRVLDEGKTPGLIGGEHSTPFGAIRACAEYFGGLGILHIDAHMDLREAFEGFAWSHASIMHNVLTRIPKIDKVVQVGIRDFGERELAFAKEAGERIDVKFDDELAESLLNGASWSAHCRQIIERLPHRVYVTFDIDALDPSLCPHTGTPVPGGLSYHQATFLLDALRRSGKHIVGFDLVEVAPGGDSAPEWDANVGARVLYKLCGLAK